MYKRQEIPSIPRHSRRRFGSPPTTRSGSDYRPPVGPGARWSHRGATQDALGRTLWTVLSAGKGSPTLSPPHLRYRASTPDHYRQTNRVYRRMRIGAAQRELSRNNAERFLATGYACVPHAGCLRPYSHTVLPKASRVCYKGDDGLWWIGKTSASTTED